MPDGPDLDAVLAVLEPHERSAVMGFAATLELPEWHALPGVRSAVFAVAVRRMADDIQAAHRKRLSELAAFREAAYALGFPDPATAAESIQRQLRRWRAASGQNVRDRDAVA